MRKIPTFLMGMVMASTLTVAVAGSTEKCQASTQECLDKMATSLAHRGWLGVELEKTENGALKISNVVPESPAEKAGLRAGDVLVSANGVRYASATDEEMGKVSEAFKPGNTITYAVLHAGHEKTVQVKLAEMPDRVRAQILGAHMMEHATASEKLPTN
jgi:S1-C subfamily serine protease